MTGADSLADVSRETRDRLETYESLLRKWNPAINLVAKSTLGDLWTRHFRDSAQLFDLCPAGATRWADLGSGGGFPGLVVAILAAERAPGLAVTLVESDVRKAAFLSTVARETGLNVRVLADRIEAVAPLSADVLSARALAPLPQLLAFAERHLAPGGRALLPKGANHAAEIAEALASWRFDLQKHPSQTDSQAVILEVTGVAHV
ncbi:16S rRNA (guanine(527)-N(7))-methyltransferase RsmG [Frigidibacter oleivorans]|uniref:16S rRNA (guanine(527)-N(7))-methyltransferase RsmG n=1 Tax=Frigidibacter oleivorans TaxID=2487129 RepID=UPI000F8DC2FA|nr:16S rRNA (guanine(527)-N(7))-methyltransferase RsmG [Frigidibacter oleivorans]